MALYTEEIGYEVKVYCEVCGWVGSVGDLEQGDCPDCDSDEIYTLGGNEEVVFGVSGEE
jgi:Zn finger protein HypA/HybF involved in hydrogenase expression